MNHDTDLLPQSMHAMRRATDKRTRETLKKHLEDSKEKMQRIPKMQFDKKAATDYAGRLDSCYMTLKQGDQRPPTGEKGRLLQVHLRLD